MDPQATFNGFCEAIQDNDIELAKEYERAYGGWRGIGGFQAMDELFDNIVRLDYSQGRYLVSKEKNLVWKKVKGT